MHQDQRVVHLIRTDYYDTNVWVKYHTNLNIKVLGNRRNFAFAFVYSLPVDVRDDVLGTAGKANLSRDKD